MIKTVLDQAVQKIADKIVKRYRPEKIILFGSYASGRTHVWSDVDIIAVKKTNKRFYDRINEVSALIPHEIPVDILVYTPEEFNKMAKGNYFIRDEVLKKGKIIYEQSL